MVRRSEIEMCQLHNWYPEFRKHSIRTKTIQLPSWFVAYLNEDSIILPPPHPEWNLLETTISSIVSELGGAVFPKLNWSSPKDATWISCDGSLKCTSAEEVVLLLKSSEHITHDMDRAFELCENEVLASLSTTDYRLNLRTWSNLSASREFRCFIKNRNVVAISQRDHTNYYPELEHHLPQINEAVTDFFRKVILPSEFATTTQEFVMDVYLDKDHRVWLIDFNPLEGSVDPLLFEWDEIERMRSAHCPEIRVTQNKAIRPSQISIHRLPYDIVDLVQSGDF